MVILKKSFLFSSAFALGLTASVCAVLLSTGAAGAGNRHMGQLAWSPSLLCCCHVCASEQGQAGTERTVDEGPAEISHQPTLPVTVSS